MLAVSPLRNSNGDEREAEVRGFATTDEFSDGLPGTALLEDINFDDLFVGFDDVDILPDLEVDPAELLGDFLAGDEEKSGSTTYAPVVPDVSGRGEENTVAIEEERKEEKDGSQEEQEVMSAATKVEGLGTITTVSSQTLEADKARKSSPGAKGTQPQGKRKVKVDWTPELHRRFVQAVEQLGVDKAVPSRILELMGIDCLTRHNIASHLQKYRSHRKHLLAREAEAASWSQRRQTYAAAAAAGGAKRDMNLWVAPTMGFPTPPPRPIQPFRPLHVWGHPSVDQPLAHAWPRPLVPAPSSPVLPPWTPQRRLPAPDPLYWHPQYHGGARDGWVPSAFTQGTPCFPQPMRFPAQPVPGILPHPLYRPPSPVPPPSRQLGPQIPLEAHPSKESIDAAIGGVLAKSWQPLPLGLKPPSLESVLMELQRQGISKIPPTCS